MRLGEALPLPYVFASNRFLLLICLDQTPKIPLTNTLRSPSGQNPVLHWRQPRRSPVSRLTNGGRAPLIVTDQQPRQCNSQVSARYGCIICNEGSHALLPAYLFLVTSEEHRRGDWLTIARSLIFSSVFVLQGVGGSALPRKVKMLLHTRAR